MCHPFEDNEPEHFDIRFELCERCGSEGRIYEAVYPRWGEPYDRDLGRCETCNGTGIAPIEVFPVEMEDLDDACD